MKNLFALTSAFVAISGTYTAENSKKPVYLDVHPVFGVGPIELSAKSFSVSLNPDDTWKVFADKVQAQVQDAYPEQNYELKTLEVLGNNLNLLDHLDEPVQEVTDAIEATFHEQRKDQLIKGYAKND